MSAMSQAKARAIVAVRSGDGCEVGIPGICAGYAQSVHHRRKRSAGGLWAPSNLLATCGDGTRGCHGWIEAHPKDAHLAGWWLRTGDGAPETVPLRMHANAMGRWWQLADDGSVTETPARPSPDPRRAP